MRVTYVVVLRFSGLYDFVVWRGVLEALEKQLLSVGVPAANISTEYSVPAGHTVPTFDFGNYCAFTESPWIGDCSYDGAGVFLNFFYTGLNPKGPLPASVNWIKIDLDNYMPSGWTAYDASLSSTAYLYVPSQCAGNSSTICRLHIAFHGCDQAYEQVGDVFMLHGGYIQWASTNNLMLLFPQTEMSFENPQSCWDWWGYVDSDYAYKQGVQMAAVRNLAAALGAMY